MAIGYGSVMTVVLIVIAVHASVRVHKEFFKGQAAIRVDAHVRGWLLSLGREMEYCRQSGKAIESQIQAETVVGPLIGGYSAHKTPMFAEARDGARTVRFAAMESVPKGATLSTTPMLWTADRRTSNFVPLGCTNTCMGLLMVLFWDGSVRLVSESEMIRLLVNVVDREGQESDRPDD